MREKGKTMGMPFDLPNGGLLLTLLMLSRERIQTGSKAAVSIPMLREVIMLAVSKLPFDEDFYLSTYNDIREAYQSGEVSNLRVHFMEEGYFEGRLGAMPDLDEVFYRETYPDVAEAITNNELESVMEHYIRAGAVEGRFANAEDRKIVTRWMKLGGKT